MNSEGGDVVLVFSCTARNSNVEAVIVAKMSLDSLLFYDEASVRYMLHEHTHYFVTIHLISKRWLHSNSAESKVVFQKLAPLAKLFTFLRGSLFVFFSGKVRPHDW